MKYYITSPKLLSFDKTTWVEATFVISCVWRSGCYSNPITPPTHQNCTPPCQFGSPQNSSRPEAPPLPSYLPAHQGCWLKQPPMATTFFGVWASTPWSSPECPSPIHPPHHPGKSWRPRFLICKDIKSLAGPRLCLQHICKWNTEESKPIPFLSQFFGGISRYFWGNNTHLKVDSNQHGLPARHLHWRWILVEVMCKASHDLLAEDVDRHVTGAARPR